MTQPKTSLNQAYKINWGFILIQAGFLIVHFLNKSLEWRWTLFPAMVYGFMVMFLVAIAALAERTK